VINRVRTNIIRSGVALLAIVGLFAQPVAVHAADVTVTAVCNVTVTFKATIPASVRQGESFTVTNIAVSPSNSYGFTVSSSTYDFAATNTSSTTYHQNFVSTNPSPTTGHNSYWAYYPNWVVNATGAVGSSVVVTIKKSVTVVQGYGTVNCSFNKVFFSVPITAPNAPSPSPSPSQSVSPSPSSGVKPSTSPSKSATPKPGTPQTSQTPSVSATPTPTESSAPDPSNAPESPTVVPLIVKVRDGSGKIIANAEVSLNGKTKGKTDDKGVVKFENVLTGNHSLLVSYAGKKVSHTIYVDDQDVGTAMVVSLPDEPIIANPLVLGGIALATLAIGTPLAIFGVRRYRSGSTLDIPADAIPLHSIASGAATPAPAETKLTNIPAIPMFDTQPTVPTPAPWESVALVGTVATPAPPAQQSTPAPVPPPEAESGVPSIILPQEQPLPAPAPEPASTAQTVENAIIAQVAPVEPPPTIQHFAQPTPTQIPVQTPSDIPPSPSTPPQNT
jgi:hypothetical protein